MAKPKGKQSQQGQRKPKQQQQQTNAARNRRRRQRRAKQKVMIKFGNGRRRRNTNTRRGPVAAVTQTVTATLGTVGPNTSGGIETEMSILLNPALIKESTGSNTFGPIQIYASTYSMWRIKYLELVLTPLVGASAVSGTVYRASLNMTAQPASINWSGLGARKHVDCLPGRQSKLVLSARDIPGPKEGWFNTSTKGDSSTSIGGSLELHSMGKTLSTYQGTQFDTGLFMAEMRATWEFANFNPQPGMLQLVKGEAKENEGTLQIEAVDGQPIKMTVPNNSRMGRAITTDSTATEIIWQVVDSGISVVSDAFPAPFNWLFKGGWWFIKKIAGLPTRTGTTEFHVFQTIADARADVPCIASETKNTNLSGSMHWVQVTPGNIGLSDAGVSRSIPSVDPGVPIVDSPLMARGPYRIMQATQTQSAIQFFPSAAGDTTIGFYFGDGSSYTTNVFFGLLYSVDSVLQQTTNGWSNYLPQSEAWMVNVSYKPATSWGNMIRVGRAVAWAKSQIGNIRFQHFLIHITDTSTRQMEFNGVVIEASLQGGTLDNPTLAYRNRTARLTTSVNLNEGTWAIGSFWTNQTGSYVTRKNVRFYTSLPANENQNHAPTMLSQIPNFQDIIFTPFQNVENTTDPLDLQDLSNFLEDKEDAGESEEEDMETADEAVDEPEGAFGWQHPEGGMAYKCQGCGRQDHPACPEMEEDDDHGTPPKVLLEKLTPEGQAARTKLLKAGFSPEHALKMAQAAYEHPAVECFKIAFLSSMGDGFSPATSRDIAWCEAREILEGNIKVD